MDNKYAVCVLEAIGGGLKLSNESDREEACTMAIKALDIQDNLREKALELIKALRKASYNHADYGKDMAIDEETAVTLVEEIFGVEESMREENKCAHCTRDKTDCCRRCTHGYYGDSEEDVKRYNLSECFRPRM